MSALGPTLNALVVNDVTSPIPVSINVYELVNAQTGTTYTVLSADWGKLITLSNGSAVAVTLPNAAADTTSFPAGWFVDVVNLGVGTVTITPTTSTIQAAATYVLRTGQGARIVSDGTNYFVHAGLLTAGAQTIAGAKTFSTMPIIPTATVAATGSDQAGAAAITTGFALVSGADDAKGVKLPTAVAGLQCIIKSSVAGKILKVYPFSGDAINALAGDAAISLASGPTAAMFIAYDATTWYTLPLLPS